jgi:hypothetical protein
MVVHTEQFAAQEPGGPTGLDVAGLTDGELRPLLPRFLQELAQWVSIKGLLALVESYGGTDIFVPAKPKIKSRLASVLSPEDFAALCSTFGGERVGVPRAHLLRTHVRARRVIALRASGKSASAVALVVGISMRRVEQITSGHLRGSPAAPSERTPPKTKPRERTAR